ncbi:MAG: hypothetical protein JWN70_1592 [Planctomycetaceae bacterium]|nr:hypothetical protein [Planctomycetaceae bacterium]
MYRGRSSLCSMIDDLVAGAQMSQILKLLVIGLLVFTASCDRVFPPAKPAKPLTVPVPSFLAGLQPVKDEPIPEPKFVDFEALNFQTPQVRSTVLKWEELFKKYKRPEDVHVAWNKLTPVSAFPPVQRKYCEFWTNVPDLVDPERGYRPRGVSGAFSMLRIECVLSENQKACPDYALVKADRYLPNGWKVFFGHQEYSGLDSLYPRLEFDLWPSYESRRKPVYFSFLPGQFSWSHDSSFDGRDYHFFLALPEALSDSKTKRLPKIKHLLRDMSVSADSFRKTCHEVADELERQMKENYSSANGVLGIRGRNHDGVLCVNDERASLIPKQADQAVKKGYMSGSSNKSSRKFLMAEEWESVLNAGLTEIAKRRRMVDQNYVEMHAALVGLLPLHEFFVNVD